MRSSVAAKRNRTTCAPCLGQVRVAVANSKTGSSAGQRVHESVTAPDDCRFSVAPAGVAVTESGNGTLQSPGSRTALSNRMGSPAATDLTRGPIFIVTVAVGSRSLR